MTLTDLEALPDPEWLIEDWLPASSVCELYGKTNIGKTFVSLDTALTIAAGLPNWHGHAVRRGGRVVYFGPEGSNWVKQRVAAWLLEHPGARAAVEQNFRYCRQSADLATPGTADRLVDAISPSSDHDPTLLVVLDTLAANTPGVNDSDPAAMSTVAQTLRDVADRTGATVLLVHHSGKRDDKVDRGSSVLPGAMDFMVLTRPTGTAGGIELTVKKARDSETGGRLGLQLAAVGNSCVVRRGGTLPRCSSEVPVSPTRGPALEAFQMWLSNRGTEPFSPRECREGAGLPEATVGRLLREAVKNGVVARLEWGTYRSADAPEVASGPSPVSGSTKAWTTPSALGEAWPKRSLSPIGERVSERLSGWAKRPPPPLVLLYGATDEDHSLTNHTRTLRWSHVAN